MARPKKEKAETRPNHVTFRLTDQERADLADAAAKAGITPNDLARYRTTAAGVSVVLAPAAERNPANDEMVQQANRLGINLNQIARRLNMTGEHEPEELRWACRQVDEILRRYLACSGL